MKKNTKQLVIYSLTVIFIGFLVYSDYQSYQPGVVMGKNYIAYFKFIMIVMPGVFLLIGLFNVWVKRETVEKHMGSESGIKGYFWALVLSSTAIGGLFAALPIGFALFKKNAKLSVILTYLGASCVCRIPMTLWEVSMLGLRFTLVRYLVSIPLIILTSILTEKLLFTTEAIEQMKQSDLF